MPTIELTVNGRIEQVDVPAEMPLLWVLRDVLGLTGTKFGCGVQLCGACTVHVDGRAKRSCQLPVSEVVGRAITTIEGLEGESADALRGAWQTDQVPQCGYCQPGQLMTAAAMLARTPEPEDEEIATEMKRVICRCGTYGRVRRAIGRAVAGTRR